MACANFFWRHKSYTADYLVHSQQRGGASVIRQLIRCSSLGLLLLLVLLLPLTKCKIQRVFVFCVVVWSKRGRQKLARF